VWNLVCGTLLRYPKEEGLKKFTKDAMINILCLTLTPCLIANNTKKMKIKTFKELPETIISPITGDVLKKQEIMGDEIGTEDEVFYPLSVYKDYGDYEQPAWVNGDVTCYCNEDTKENLYIPYGKA